MYLQRVFELTRLIAFGALLFVWWAKPAANQKSVRGIASSTVSFAVPFVQAIFPVLMSSALSYQLLSEIMGTADTAMYVVPAVSMSHVGLQLYPVVVFLLLKDTYLAAIALSWAIGVITMAVISVLTQSWDQFFMLVGYVLLSGILMYDHHRNNKAVFQLVSRLQQSLEENARLEVEARAEELRAMIGNVAHDLKTVRKCTCSLDLFLSGL
jgi:signal transduction histidine kinase